MKKRGIGHVEIVLAITIFIGFLFAALYFFNPLNVDRVVDASLVYTLDEVSDEISSQVLSYNLVLNSGAPTGNLRISIPNVPSGYEVRVENNQLGSTVISNYDPDSGEVYFQRGGEEERFFTIKFSDVYISGTLSDGTLLTGDQYTISSSDERTYWSESKARNLMSEYGADYLALKERFNLPDNFGFEVMWDGMTSEIKAENEIPDNIEVYSKQDRQEIIKSDGSVVFADLIVKVW